MGAAIRVKALAVAWEGNVPRIVHKPGEAWFQPLSGTKNGKRERGCWFLSCPCCGDPLSLYSYRPRVEADKLTVAGLVKCTHGGCGIRVSVIEGRAVLV